MPRIEMFGINLYLFRRKYSILFILLFVGASTMPAQDLSLLQEGDFKGEMKYLLYTPSEANKKNNALPLLLFLHGGGEGGDSIALVTHHGPTKLIAEGKEFPFYVLAPQNPYKKGFWDDRIVEALLKHMIDSLLIDTSRVYLAGMSRGGYGAWRLAMNNSEMFAAIVSVCAASIPIPYLPRLKDVPIWLFHGVKDEVIPAEQTIHAYSKLKMEGAYVELTLYPEARHDSWTETFNNEEVYHWMLQKKKP